MRRRGDHGRHRRVGADRSGNAKVLLDIDAVNVAAVNDLVPADNLAYLLRYDTMYGRYDWSKPSTGPPPQITVPGRDFRRPGTLPVGSGHDRAAVHAVLFGALGGPHQPSQPVIEVRPTTSLPWTAYRYDAPHRSHASRAATPGRAQAVPGCHTTLAAFFADRRQSKSGLSALRAPAQRPLGDTILEGSPSNDVHIEQLLRCDQFRVVATD
jgi:hypothetical protein